MKRILPLLSIVLLASCNVGLKTVTVTMPLFDYEKETIYTQQFQMTIPTGFKELIERSVDADKTHLYYYLPDSSLIYITNTGTLHPNLHNIKALGDSIYEFRFQYKELWKSINEALGEEVLKVLPDTLELSGIDADSFYWKDITNYPEDIDTNGDTPSGVSTGESGFLGKTLFPDLKGLQNSPNDNIIVVINKNLSPEGAAETYSHEANGHALLYIINGGDHNGASHDFKGSEDQNKRLEKMIIESKKETIKNMKEL